MTDHYDELHQGRRTATVYYWLDPDTGAALYHTGVNDEMSIPFFPDVGAAETYLDHRATIGDKEDYAGYSLYEATTKKVGDAVDVLTEQQGIGDLLTPDD